MEDGNNRCRRQFFEGNRLCLHTEGFNRLTELIADIFRLISFIYILHKTVIRNRTLQIRIYRCDLRSNFRDKRHEVCIVFYASGFCEYDTFRDFLDNC